MDIHPYTSIALPSHEVAVPSLTSSASTLNYFNATLHNTMQTISDEKRDNDVKPPFLDAFIAHVAHEETPRIHDHIVVSHVRDGEANDDDVDMAEQIEAEAYFSERRRKLDEAMKRDTLYAPPPPRNEPRLIFKTSSDTMDTPPAQDAYQDGDIIPDAHDPAYTSLTPRIYFPYSLLTYVPPFNTDELPRDPDVKGVPRNYRAWSRSGRPKLEVEGATRSERKADFTMFGRVWRPSGGDSDGDSTEEEGDGREKDRKRKRKNKKKGVNGRSMVPIERPRRMVRGTKLAEVLAQSYVKKRAVATTTTPATAVTQWAGGIPINSIPHITPITAPALTALEEDEHAAGPHANTIPPDTLPVINVTPSTTTNIPDATIPTMELCVPSVDYLSASQDLSHTPTPDPEAEAEAEAGAGDDEESRAQERAVKQNLIERLQRGMGAASIGKDMVAASILVDVSKGADEGRKRERVVEEETVDSDDASSPKKPRTSYRLHLKRSNRTVYPPVSPSPSFSPSPLPRSHQKRQSRPSPKSPKPSRDRSRVVTTRPPTPTVESPPSRKRPRAPPKDRTLTVTPSTSTSSLNGAIPPGTTTMPADHPPGVVTRPPRIPPSVPLSRPHARVSASSLRVPVGIPLRTMPPEVPIIEGYPGLYRRFPLILQYEGILSGAVRAMMGGGSEGLGVYGATGSAVGANQKNGLLVDGIGGVDLGRTNNPPPTDYSMSTYILNVGGDYAGTSNMDALTLHHRFDLRTWDNGYPTVISIPAAEDAPLPAPIPIPVVPGTDAESLSAPAATATGFTRRPHNGNYNPPRDIRDLYTPRYMKGSGGKKLALCPICWEDVERGGEGRQEWNHTKTSQHNYHMQYYHGISPTHCLPFSPPIAYRTGHIPRPQSNEKTELLQGQCHNCKQWIALEGSKVGELKVKELFWWKHAASCHKESRLEGETDIFLEDDAYKRLLAWEAAHPGETP